MGGIIRAKENLLTESAPTAENQKEKTRMIPILPGEMALEHWKDRTGYEVCV